MATILVVDDDQNLLKMLHRTLAYEGFQVVTAQNGQAAMARLRSEGPDLIVLDWMMPELNGLEMMTDLRAAGDHIPILMLTARDAIEHRVTGLDSGADDYLVKPFASSELLARLKALLRRFEPTAKEKSFRFTDLYLNLTTRQTHRGERQFELTPREFELLHYFLRHPGRVLSRNSILENVWGYDFGGEDNVLEVYIGYLRKKTEAGGERRLIQTVRGVGYVLRET
jgi:two-component system response regulator MprA